MQQVKYLLLKQKHVEEQTNDLQEAAIDNLIHDILWSELPECYDETSISMYCQKIYEYVYTRYKEVA